MRNLGSIREFCVSHTKKNNNNKAMLTLVYEEEEEECEWGDTEGNYNRRFKEGNALFNDALNTFYLRLYGVGHIIKDHSDNEGKHAAATWAVPQT